MLYIATGIFILHLFLNSASSLSKTNMVNREQNALKVSTVAVTTIKQHFWIFGEILLVFLAFKRTLPYYPPGSQDPDPHKLDPTSKSEPVMPYRYPN
jgi:hypothetical protein